MAKADKIYRAKRQPQELDGQSISSTARENEQRAQRKRDFAQMRHAVFSILGVVAGVIYAVVTLR